MSHTWHYGEPVDGILHVRIEMEDRPVNVLSRAALQELSELVNYIGQTTEISAVLFKSGKSGNFFAGADVTELKDLKGEQAVLEISRFGQRIFQDLEDLKVTTIALIAGSCVGGGLEFAMSCNYRIVANDRKTLLALPEVKLGLIPGWGGTVRMPRLIGLIDSLPMILTGKMINGFQARSRGLVHDVVPAEALDNVGVQIAKAVRDARNIKAVEQRLFRPKKQPLWKRTLAKTTFIKKYALKKAEQEVQSKAHGHYPAPIVAINTLRSNLGQSEAVAFKNESTAISQLGENPVTVECMRLFFLQEGSKKPPASLKVPIRPDSVNNVAVIGAGAMGAGIAMLTARKGIWTRIKDLNPEFVGNGMRTIRGILKKDVSRRRLSKLEATQVLDHLSPTTDYRGLKNADIVIEAILEDVEIKRKLFRELAEATGPETVLATNTSSLLVSEIAKDIPHPERIVGLHFFNPPHKMPLVEIIKTHQTSPEALAKTIALVQRIGKTMVVVGDCAGFLVNRLLSPYMNEAGFLLLEVDDPMEIEKAAIEFGMPMGPLELTDLVGIDVAAHVAENMHAAYGDRMQPAPLWQRLKQLRGQNEAADTRLLIKSGKKKRINPLVAGAIASMKRDARISTAVPTKDAIIERLVYPIINEAARCLDENIVEQPEDVDLAMVFGTGFAPFRGGPMRYADSIGFDNVVSSLEKYAAQHSRLTPSDALRNLAAQGPGITDPFRDQSDRAVA